jgi:hypothetical protein
LLKEVAEFRIEEKDARKLFSKNEGKVLGEKGVFEVRQIFLDTSDPRYFEVGKLEEKFKVKKTYFFSSWNIERKYTKSELEKAALFQLIFMPEFEPSGEECGTIYDETTACSICGAGAKQTNPLFLRKSSIPKSKDFSYTIADNELIVSARSKELFQNAGITGVEYGPIVLNKRTKEPSTEWFQMLITNSSVEIHPISKFGNEPFDEDKKGEYRCANGHKAGLNILSELTVQRETLGKFDIISTRQFVGLRLGLLRPHRLIVVSPKVRMIIAENKLKGVKIEVAHSL